VQGNFILDTGATFVALTSQFASRARIDTEPARPADYENGQRHSTCRHWVALRLQQEGEVVEGRRCFVMFGAEHPIFPIRAADLLPSVECPVFWTNEKSLIRTEPIAPIKPTHSMRSRPRLGSPIALVSHEYLQITIVTSGQSEPWTKKPLERAPDKTMLTVFRTACFLDGSAALSSIRLPQHNALKTTIFGNGGKKVTSEADLEFMTKTLWNIIAR
jgi:hypothetical protein